MDKESGNATGVEAEEKLENLIVRRPFQNKRKKDSEQESGTSSDESIKAHEICRVKTPKKKEPKVKKPKVEGEPSEEEEEEKPKTPKKKSTPRKAPVKRGLATEEEEPDSQKEVKPSLSKRALAKKAQ